MVDKRKTPHKFDEEVKQSIVKLYESGKSQNALATDAVSPIARWVKQYSTVKIDDGTSLRFDKFNNYKKEILNWRKKISSKKSDCHIHAPLHERLEAIHILRYEHTVVTLCRVLKVNRSTYYKYFSDKVAPRTLENQQI